MTSDPVQNAAPETEYGLIVQLAENPPKLLTTFLRLVLNYQYGLDLLLVRTLPEASPILVEHSSSIRCAFLIQDQELRSKNPIAALSRRNTVPFFLILPPALAEQHQPLTKSAKNISVCSWDDVFGEQQTSLQQSITTAFEEYDLGQIRVDAEDTSHEEMQKRVEQRLKHLDTIPTLPEVMARITNLLKNPETKIEDLEEVLLDDPAIVHKLLQVVNSPAFAGIKAKEGWTLKEAIVRMGFKQVGTIAQQIKLINSLIKPQESPFDLRRFWEHSLGCALIADKLYKDKLIPFEHEIEFDEYWLGSLLHDIGRLILGFFFWDYYENVLKRMLGSTKVSFRRAETRLGDVVNHEYLGQLLLLNANAKPELVEAVATHHSTGGMPKPLVCLIHLADSLCKGLDMGYLPEEQEMYSASVLHALKLTRKDMEGIKESLGEPMVLEIKELVNRCIQA